MPTCLSRNSGTKTNQSAFTLIELLIVVAIIAILAAIAVPNFLDAQVRAKISRVHSDQRSMATAIESYLVDHNTVWGARDIMDRTPHGQSLARLVAYSFLTTPVAYMTTFPRDPFQFAARNNTRLEEEFQYQTSHKDTTGDWDRPRLRGYIWGVNSLGPSLGRSGPSFRNVLIGDTVERQCYIYDATNGVKSEGFLLRTNKGVMSTPDLTAGV